MMRMESSPELPSALSPPERAERARLMRVMLLLLGLCLVPIGLSYLPGVGVATLVAPFGALAALVVVTAIARARKALTRALAIAIASWGVAALEFSASIPQPPAALWLTKRVCRDDQGAWILLCPFALMFDVLMVLFLGLAYVAWAFAWGLEHLGAPVFFGGALVAALVGVTALRRPDARP